MCNVWMRSLAVIVIDLAAVLLQLIGLYLAGVNCVSSFILTMAALLDLVG